MRKVKSFNCTNGERTKLLIKAEENIFAFLSLENRDKKSNANKYAISILGLGQ